MEKKLFLSLALLLTTYASMYAEDVNYSWYRLIDINNHVSLERVNETASNPTVLTSSLLENSNEDNLDSGWYVLDSSFEYGERIVISGDVHLILKDGCTLTAQKGIRINTDATFTIYAQAQLGDGMGKIVAQISEHDKAAIGGNKNYEAGRLLIYGGVIEATCKDGSKYAAGIGGGYGDGSGMKEIAIYHGKVTATGAEYGAGIGGGKNNKHPGPINIYGGDIKANGGTGGAGIGGGQNRGNWPVNIYGGTVVALGKDGKSAFSLYGSAGIGAGSEGHQTARISIFGGTVTAQGYSGAGIGGSYKGNGGDIYIYGGTVTAKAGICAAGIGGGRRGDGGDVRISGGTVTAENFSQGTTGAAIGGGIYSKGGYIEITGGHVTTKTNKHFGNVDGDAACNIGSGEGEEGQTITLGRNICVKPQSGLVVAGNRIDACKGPGTGHSGDRLDWTVEVYECSHNLTYTLNEDGHAERCKHCEYSSSGPHTYIGENTACSICGYGKAVTIASLAFLQTPTASLEGYNSANYDVVEGATIALPECSQVPDGWKFVGWSKKYNTYTVDFASIEATDNETDLYQPGDDYKVSGNALFFARYRYDFTPTWTWDEDLTTASLTIQATGGEPISVTPVTVGTPTTVSASPTALGSITNTATATYQSGDDTSGYTTYEFATQHTISKYWDYSLMEDDNTSMLSASNGQTGNVRLPNRTFYKNGNWDTLCLPFNVEDIISSPLTGATVKEMTDASFDRSTGKLTLTFADATSIKAGQAYLIKWEDTGDYNLTDALFTGVTLANYLCDDEISVDDQGTANVTFMGTYKKLSFDADDKSILLLDENNTLYYPQSQVSIGAQRAYFKLDGLTVGDNAADARVFVLNFGDGAITTGINTPDAPLQTPHGWYTLDGRRLSGMPLQKGIYINNGKKVVIK